MIGSWLGSFTIIMGKGVFLFLFDPFWDMRVFVCVCWVRGVVVLLETSRVGIVLRMADAKEYRRAADAAAAATDEDDDLAYGD